MKRKRKSREKKEKKAISTALLLDALDFCSEGVLIVEIDSDEEGMVDLGIKYCNSACEMILSMKKEEISGQKSKSSDFEPNGSISLDLDGRIVRDIKKEGGKKEMSEFFWKTVLRCIQSESEEIIAENFESILDFDSLIKRSGFLFISGRFQRKILDGENEVVMVTLCANYHEYPLYEHRIMDLDEQQWLLHLNELNQIEGQMQFWDPEKMDIFNLRTTDKYDQVYFGGKDGEKRWLYHDEGMNKEQIEWWGLACGKFIGQEEPGEVHNVIELQGSEDQKWVTIYLRYLDSMDLKDGKFYRRKKDEDIQGFRHRFIVKLEDVTEKKRMENINDMQKQFINGCQNMMDLLEPMKDGHVRYLLMNESCQRLFDSIGCFKAQGKTSKELGLDLKHVKMYTDYIKKMEKEKASVSDTIHDSVLKKWYHVNAFRADENKYGFILTDVTENKELEFQLLEGKQNLERQVEERTKDLNLALMARSRFLATMSHEIRTPLYGIMNSLSHFSEVENLKSESKEVLQIAKICGEQLLTVIGDVLDFSKIDAKEVELDLHVSKLLNTLEESLEVVSVNSMKKMLPLIFKSNIPIGLKANLDHGRIRQIIINLLSNALKFTSEGEIQMTAEYDETDGNLKVSVRDTGIGIQESFKEKIFLPFIQSDSSITRKYGGSGLGLCICKLLCEMMGGRLWMESTEGIGSTFYFSIPAQIVEAPRDKETALLQDIQTNIRQQTKNTNLVVLVDSNETQLSVTKEFFNTDLLIDCRTFKDISEIDLNQEYKERTTLFLVDYNESDKDLERLEAWCKENKKTLVLTGRREDNRKEFQLDTLHKPFRSKELYLLVSRVFLGSQIYLEKEKPLEMKQLTGLKVLVAEDNLLNQKVIKRTLLKFGIDPSIVDNGKKAVEAVKQSDFHVILMDCMMPVMGGIEATQQIRRLSDRQKNKIKIVALTADAMADHRKVCLESGMSEVLTKPVDQTLLYQSLHQVYAHVGVK
eukprot:TRINITY_DN2175_c0_g1_i1.p1 TRINITY_DN2175_c0_g1~~TRINITY_DN2175_c0_g1_i1.p1  ORF type:complete len:984 (-),score=258.32 TRINITY_DN2175_c0_g1_i1:93-3044(-)